MKVLITAISHWLDRPSGSAKIAFDEALELKRRGQEVWMLARGNPTLPEHQVVDGINLLRYVEQPVAPWNPARASVHQRAIAGVLARHIPKLDVVHAHVPLAGVAAFRFYGESAYACYTVHSPAAMEMAIEWKSASLARRITAPIGISLLNRIEKECISRSNVVTALSRYTRDCIRRIHGSQFADRLQLVSGWVDTSRFVPLEDRVRAKEQLGWPIDLPVLFTLRRLTARMGLDRLLAAAHRTLREGLRFHLVIAGNGPLRQALEQQADRLGIKSSVTFMGRVPDDVLSIAYGACDAFVLPTAELECFGIIALEALAAGRPVLATPVGAIPETIRRFEPAWLAESADADDIATLLQKYLRGALPEHPPALLHDRVDRMYSSRKLLGEFVDTTVSTVAGKERQLVPAAYAAN
jgi:glycosyltransferase involved in cell wall biosynthesis